MRRLISLGFGKLSRSLRAGVNPIKQPGNHTGPSLRCVNRIQKTLVLIAASPIALPAAAHSTFAPAPEICASPAAPRPTGSRTTPPRPISASRSPTTPARARSADAAGRPRRDRRFRAGRRFQRQGAAPCRSSTPIRTVTLDADTAKPDVTVNLSADAAAAGLQDLRPFGAVLAAGRRGAARRDVEDQPAARSDRSHAKHRLDPRIPSAR